MRTALNLSAAADRQQRRWEPQKKACDTLELEGAASEFHTMQCRIDAVHICWTGWSSNGVAFI
eukprot:351291-Chlamydomonas_euryale.AAC.3